MNKTKALYERSKKIIPGGTQLLSKRQEMYAPDLWPAYFKKAKGCEIVDLDGNRWIDMSNMSVGAAILGYADPDVNKAVDYVIKNGNISTLNGPEEVECAELMLEINPWAEMVRFARGGGEANTIAVRIARAKTRKDIVLFCGYHGWHDWYLSANLASDSALDGHHLTGLSPLGVPRNLTGSAYTFHYNDTQGFLDLIKRYEGKIGAVVLESIRNDEPKKGFFETIREETKKNNIVLIVDEVSAGFRMNIGGAHMLFGLEPDIAVYAKAISNGYPMGAIVGKGSVMQAAQESFISSTYWTERIGPAATLATVRKLRSLNVPEYLKSCGKTVQEGWKNAAMKNELKIHVGGIHPLGHFSFDYEKPLILKTLFTQLMLEKGFLATTGYYASWAHRSHHISRYLSAVEDTFREIRKAIESGKPESYLKGPVCHAGFQRLT
jgi:glutamate-1-semialdehyde 2,1-aminomutase